MKLPRDLSGTEVARRLTRHYGYRVTRSPGGYMTLTAGSDQHRVTVPRHRDVRVAHAGRGHRRRSGISRPAKADSTGHPLRSM